MRNSTDLLRFMEAGGIQRCHNRPQMHYRQRVDSHSWGVALMVWQIMEACEGFTLMAALVHDCGELKTGDVPAPVKREHPDIGVKLNAMEDQHLRAHDMMFELSPVEAAVVHAADKLEFVRWMKQESYMGNRYAGVPFQRGYEYARDSIRALRELNETYADRAAKILEAILSYAP